MTKNIIYHNKKVTIMGLGLHGGGLAITKWLAKQGAKILVTDTKTKKELKESIEKLKKYKITYVLGKHREQDFKNRDIIIKNPGVPKESKYLKMAQKNNIPIETDMSIFFGLCKAKIIGVTGTKGKSTSASLIYKILKSEYNNVVLAGNIRISPLEILDEINNETLVVLELSSWQLEDMNHIKKSPKISLMTNLLPDHLNRYKSMSDYIKSKKIIFKYQNESDIAILNYDNDLTKNIFNELKAKKIVYSKNYIKNDNSVYIKNGWIKYRYEKRDNIVLPVKDIKLPGQHNLENVLSAIAVAKILNISNQNIRKSVKSFKGIPDRLELIRTWKGIKFYNDTTATAPDAAIVGLKSFKDGVILIAGGYDKNLQYNKFSKEIFNKAYFTILFKGTATKKIIIEFKKIDYQSYQVVNNMDEAVEMAVKKIPNQCKKILLSPGAASFGIFINEFDRGDQFKRKVKSLK
ncbi:MAG: UDP-N-acetylmuramoyl-L-alanine--D-glutamate ligase [bacterium]|nr:UDP-N-acetylmuramoyl-L-alanine--D-glutamate ligase [bacterium]